jgi:hypothetical protein
VATIKAAQWRIAVIGGAIQADGRVVADPDVFGLATRCIGLLLSLQDARLAMWANMNDWSEVVLE